MRTILVKSGTIVDGSGEKAFSGHLLIRDDTIESIFQKQDALPDADMVIDADGDVVSPGFIDMHSHSDWNLPLSNHPETLKCLPEQGVTTIVGGNCGVSPAPVKQEKTRLLDNFTSMMLDEPLEYRWESIADFLAAMDTAKPVVNMAQLAGHASIRYAAAEKERGPLAKHELQACLDLTERSLQEGACGLSFGLGYDPGMYSPVDELEAFCKVAARADKTVTVHLKALSRISPCYPVTCLKPHNLRALKEMIDIAKATGIKLQLSHFIFVGRNSWSTYREALDMVDAARKEGVDVMIDAFPYTCGNTTILVPFPYWFLKTLPGGYDSRFAIARLRLELELGFRLVGFLYKDFQVMDAGVAGYENLNGLTIEEIARKWNTSSFQAMLKLSRESNGAALMLFHTYSGDPGFEKPLDAVLTHDLCLYETDAIIKNTGHPNPAGMGTFPKLLGSYVRDKKQLSLETAVNRMTHASALRFGLKKQGLLKPGMAADIVIFDPETISDSPPVGANPAGKPRGIKHVFINGVQTVKNGDYIPEARAGKPIRVA
ncbi:MAG: amidohydrolase family protein [Desulfobacterales bacterium]